MSHSQDTWISCFLFGAELIPSCDCQISLPPDCKILELLDLLMPALRWFQQSRKPTSKGVGQENYFPMHATMFIIIITIMINKNDDLSSHISLEKSFHFFFRTKSNLSLRPRQQENQLLQISLIKWQGGFNNRGQGLTGDPRITTNKPTMNKQ